MAALLMLPVFPLLLATYLPGRIKAAVKHPMLAAVKGWDQAMFMRCATRERSWVRVTNPRL